MLSFRNKRGGKQTPHENKGLLRQRWKDLCLSTLMDLIETLASDDAIRIKELQGVVYNCLMWMCILYAIVLCL